ncbi:MAG: FkbM family methyltransferase [Smithella sp.]
MSYSYREDFGLWWPDWDTKAVQNFEYIKRNLNTMDYAISQCKEKRVCVQAGGHAGLWPIELSKHFDTVYTFEPDPDLYGCIQDNIDDRFFSISESKFSVYNFGLGESSYNTYIKRSGSSGTNRINTNEDGFEIEVKPLDAFKLDVLDALFLDVEHYELQALKGAEQTIKRCRPIIQVEELSSSDNSVREYLESLGYRYDKKFKNDRVYLP